MSFFIAKLDQEDFHWLTYYNKVCENGSQAMLLNKVKVIKNKNGLFWLNTIKISIPPIYYLSFLFAVLWIWLRGWALIVLTLFFALSFLPFWKSFHIWAFKRGLRKSGYKESITILPIEQGLEEVYYI